MTAILNFDASQVAPSTGTGDALPAGWYNAMIDESEMKPTKDATPQEPSAYLQLRFNIVDGPYMNRKVFARLNLQNKSPIASEIARKELSAICHAIGRLQVSDSGMLHGVPLKIKLKVRKADEEKGYEATNDISAFKNINEQVQLVTALASTTAPGIPGVPAMGVTPPPMGMAPQGWQPPVQGAQAPQGYQPPAQAPQQAPQGWQPPAQAQPWQGQPQQPQQPAPQQQFAPAPQQPQQPQYAPAPQQYAQPPVQQPAPQQFAQPPVQQPQAPAPAPVQGGAVPPWMQQPTQ